MTDLSRRKALQSVAVAGVGAPLLAACGSSDQQVATDPGTPTTPAATDSTPAATDSPKGFTTTDQIPVGSGTIFASQEVVVTQPTEGDFKCFSSICPHQGCRVTAVTQTIDCKCHGSEFALTDGAVLAGPANTGLQERQIKVDGDVITLV